MDKFTQAWTRRAVGQNYKDKINLFATVDKNERFYAGKHWEGVKANGLPTPIIPVSKRITDYKIASIAANPVSMRITAHGVSDGAQDIEAQVKKERR